jgi:predicted amidohydrolase
MTNHAGDEGAARFSGGSRTVDPVGRELAVAGGGQPLQTADVDCGAARRARFRLPIGRDSNRDLIHRRIERLADGLGVSHNVLSS